VAFRAALSDEGQEVTHSTTVAQRRDQAMMEQALAPPLWWARVICDHYNLYALL
jgi:hypothetical protein